MPIVTPRLALRLPTSRDLPDLVRLLRVKSVKQLILIRFAYTRAEGRSFVRMARQSYDSGRALYLAITRLDDNAYLGGVGLDHFSPRDGLAHIGYWLGRPYWGNGYATEAASAVCGIAFARLGIHRIETGVLALNQRSSAVLGRLGFRQEGRSRERTRIEGVWQDDLTFGLLKSEWRSFELRG